MPVIGYVPQDPTDKVIQGEQMRSMASYSSLGMAPTPLALATQAASILGFVQPGVTSVIANESTDFELYSEQSIPTKGTLVNVFDGSLVSVNAALATPCGALVPGPFSWAMPTPQFVQASIIWAISGTTKDSTGASLASCRIVALETGRISQENVEASVGETISDGSGNYSLPVPMNIAYQLVAYKPGSPDVAGVTRNDVTPLAIG